jgi:probable phosphoglycerate mutase
MFPQTNAASLSMLLLRHGQSEWNAVRRWQGLADTPLTPLGRRQAASCAAVLGALGPGFAAVRSSPLRRAAETGDIIAARLGLGAVACDDRLREADAGEWQGMTPDEIEAAYPGFLADHLRPPGFEAFEHVVERVFPALHDLASTGDPADGSLLVTTHSGVIRSIVRRLGETDERIPNVGGVWIEVTPSQRSVIDASAGVELGGRFDPDGIGRTGVDAPGEDPGEQADQADAHRRAQR